ncbi:MAG: electron transfer flavoprotein subunit alpha/FixB family protein [Chlorobiaceae bacterium]|nr:electron transfer flavoprotein subunit alpha/FixB family protein [Chlorobiaceae bacterium]
MKLLLVGESRDGRLPGEVLELFGFADVLGAETSMVLVGSPDVLPLFSGRLYLADIRLYGEYNPEVHKRLVLKAIDQERPDAVVFLHSSYGWDLAPRVAAAMKVAQVSAVTGIDGEGFTVDSCNGKMRRTVKPSTSSFVLTLQPGAFPALRISGIPEIIPIDADQATRVEYIGSRKPEAGVDLSRATVIVSAGRGIGKQEHLDLVRDLASVLGGEIGASRPVVDAGWLQRSLQVGTTGQTVSPELYVACGISGAIQHVAGMRGAGFVLAVNTDRDAPIGDVADLLVVADIVQFLPALTSRIKAWQASGF